MYLGGDGLARGYWNRPELTADKFVRTPAHLGDPARFLYRTGDLARWLPDGTLEFLGRIDNQAKIRGFRVEPGEIETVLRAHPAVRECVVTVLGTGARHKRLVAYCVFETGSPPPNASTLRRFLAEKLPDYMVPSAFVTLPALPLTPNGKVDRLALPAPDQDRPQLEREYVPPHDQVELQLTQIWESILNVRPIGTQDKFFDLGGHSLLAVRLTAQIEKTFGRRLRLATIFQAPTIGQLAAILREEVKESSVTGKTSIVEIQATGCRPPLFLVHGAGGGMFWGYVNLSKHLGIDQPVYGFKSRALDGRPELNRVQEIASDYVHDLRQVQPHGPYYLAGYCFGGIVAYEMGRQLSEAGEPVAFVGLLNCAPPNSRYGKVRWSLRWSLRFARNLLHWLNYCRDWSRTQRRDFIRWKWSLLKKRLAVRTRSSDRHLRRVQAGDLVDLSAYTQEERKIWEAHIQALLSYEPQQFPGKVHLFRSPGHPLWCSFEPDYGWGDFAAGGVEIQVVPGAHEKILEEPCVESLAELLKSVLANIQSSSTPQAPASASAIPAASSGPSADYAVETTYAERFALAARRLPAAVAVRWNGENLSYDELNRRANRLAHYLQQRGVGPESLVGICLDRSFDLTVALLAVLKAGGAYLPLDPQYPTERLEYMLADSAATLVLTRRTLGKGLRGVAQEKLIFLDDQPQKESLGRCPDEDPENRAGPDNLAYVIYTSGSTGNPKGVAITHRALLNHNFAVRDAYRLQAADRVLQFAPISFDISVEEIFPTWLSSGTVVLRPTNPGLSPVQLLEEIEQEKITLLNLPTAFWHELVEALRGKPLPPSVRLVVVGGEKVSDEAFRRWQEHAPEAVQLMNGYGVTEATVSSTLYAARPGDQNLPIGRPLANAFALVLDEANRPVPVGTPGELYIGGTSLARGYWKRPELTAERFIPNPFPQIRSERLYKTGDLVRLRDDGNLEFIGRRDEQVKLRGYRIELGEIEAALRQHADLKDAAVAVREDGPGKKRLIAYCVPRTSPGPIGPQLALFLKTKLPAYMVPSSFVTLDALPLTPAGKLDRRALPEVEAGRPELGEAYVPPSNPLEEQLAQIWSEVLGVSPVGIEDNFFDLGGDSLLAIKVTSRIRDIVHVEVSINQLFSCPTVAALAGHLAKSGHPMLNVAANSSPTTITSAQQRIWFLDIFEPQLSPYNRAVGLELHGRLDPDALVRSLNALAKRHEALRAVFPVQNGQPVKYLFAGEGLPLAVTDLTDLPESERAQEARKRATAEAARTHITTQPALRPVLFRLGPEQHWLLIILHELVADARSLGLVVEELTTLYGAFAAGRPDPRPPLVAAYTEAADALRLSPEAIQRDLQYWAAKLKGAPPLLMLPADRPRPDHRPDAGARYSFQITRELIRALEEMAKQSGTTLFTTMLGAFASLLSRYTSTSDIVIGTLLPVAGCTAFEDTVGNFENPVALRCMLEDDPKFSDLIARLQKSVESASAHSRTPFVEVVEHLNPPRNPSYTPVFQVMLTVQEQPLREIEAAGVRFSPFEVDTGTAQVDLALQLTRTTGGFTGAIEYSPGLFDHDRIARLAESLTTLLRAIIATPNARISALPIVPQADLARLQDWNRTTTPYPQTQTLADLFREQAERTPEAAALVWGQQTLSYQQLRTRAELIARELQRLGVKPETLVGICLDRSPHMVAAILGTLISGGAYVPLDPAYPRERLDFILRDANAAVLLTQRKFVGALSAGKAKVVCVDELKRGDPPALALTSKATPENLAYVIYTSGSTGLPKGVALEHRNAVAFVAWARQAFTAEELRGVLAATSICFDLSVFELFVPLASGGKVILADNPLALASLPAAGDVTLVNTVPSAIRELLRIRGIPSSVKVVNLAGEPLAAALVDEIYSETAAEKVHDLYGPTETATYSTFALRRRGEPATIGRPLANEQVYILDSRLQLLPIGVPGELYIGGVGVAREYLGRPELTAQRFLDNPLVPGTRLYKTGDLARWREDGNLEYLGRADHQVKIRGFRIELGEIESVLKSLPGVRDAVAVAREDHPGDKRLVAYLVGPARNAAAVPDLRAALRQRLPDYMLPGALVWLEQLPLTPNGKIDRKNLPAPDQPNRAQEDFVAPRNPIEEQLATIWRQVLHLNQVSVLDNFFNLGGHSLLAIQVASRVREVLKVELPLFAVFTAPTIAALSEGIGSGVWSSDTTPVIPVRRVSRDASIQASFVQERLWFLHQLHPQSAAYNVPSGLRLKGRLDLSALEKALNLLVARHESLRTTFRYAEERLQQVIAPALTLRLVLTDLTAGDPATTQDLTRWLTAEAQKPFDLEKGPLIRVALARVAEAEHVLALVLHHTIADGWSLAVLFQEWASLYDSLTGGAAPALAELPVQYADFAAWQRQTMPGPILERELGYWKQALAGAPSVIDLPCDAAQSSQETASSADRFTISLPSDLSSQIAEMGQKQGATPFIVFTAGLALALSKWTGQEDLVLGTVVAGRHRRELEGLIGCFMNFLPLRIRLAGDETCEAVLQHCRQVVLDGQTHQDCPFERIVEAVNPQRRLNGNPLYNVALLLQNFPPELFPSGSVQATPVPVQTNSPLLDLRFEVELTSSGFSLSCEYRTELFARATIEQFVSFYAECLQALACRPGSRWAELRLTPALQAQAAVAPCRQSRQSIRVAATFTAEPLAEPLRYWLSELQIPAGIEFTPYNQVFQQLLDPGSALSANTRGLNLVLLRLQDWESGPADGKESTVRQDLSRNAAEFIAALSAAATRASVPFLVCICPASPELLREPNRASLLAETEQRLSEGLQATPGVNLLTSEDLSRLYPVIDYYDASGDELGHIPYTPVFFTALATAVARKFHTLNRPPFKVIALDCDNTLWGGVCGEDGPDGVKLDEPYRALQVFMRAQLDYGMLLCLCSKNNADDVLAAFSRRTDMPLRPEHFAAVRLNWEAKSSNLKALARELGLSLDSFVFVDDNPVECAEVEANCPEVQVVQLPPDLAQLATFLAHCWVFDRQSVTTEDRRRVELYRQNQQREQLRAASPTLEDFLSSLELKIGINPMTDRQVPRVAQLTQRTNQFNATTRRLSESEVRRMAADWQILAVNVSDRFGDYGLAGVVIFRVAGQALEVHSFLLSCRVLGRGIEHKIVAHLGEVASQAGLDWIDLHYVQTGKNKPVFDFLENIAGHYKQPLNGGVLFRVPASVAASIRFNSPEASPAAARANPELEPASAPARPTAIGTRKFSGYAQIAVSANNAQAIHDLIESKKVLRISSQATYVGPNTALERQLAELWQKLLHIDRVGVQDNFFELGGHSLLAVRLFAEIEKLTGRKLPLITLFQAPTIKQLAGVLSDQHASGAPSLLVPIQPKGSRRPLFLVHGAGGDVLWGYANLATHMSPEQPIYGIKSRGQVGLEECTRVEQMAECYLKEVRKFQPEGPYFLGGYCFGGNVAYEMARQLHAAGQKVALVALLDSAPANAGYERVTWWRPGYVVRFASNAYDWLRDFAALSSSERSSFVFRKLRTFGRKLKRKWTPPSAPQPFDVEEVIDPNHFPEQELRLWRIHLGAMNEHAEGEYAGAVALLRTSGQPLFCSLEEDFCWGKLARGGVRVIRIPGSHEKVFMEPHVRALAAELEQLLQETQPAGETASDKIPSTTPS